MPEPLLKQLGESWWAVWPSHRVTWEVGRIHEGRDTLSAEVTIGQEGAGTLHWARVNLASTQARSGLTKALDEAHPGPPWRSIVEQTCREIARVHRTGDPATALEAAAPDAGRWWVEPWIPLGQLTVIFGDGGAGKSLLALSLATAGLLGHTLGGPWLPAAIHRVLYLDWETERRDHQERLWGLCGRRELPDPQALWHRRMVRGVADDVAAIRVEADLHEVDLVICDSLGPACGAEPETADAAVRALMALRSLARTTLVIAHVSKASADQKVSRPFGSVYVQNLARSVIEARGESADETLTVSLYHRKANQGRLAKPIGITYTFGNQGEIDMARTQPDAAHATIAEQIMASLRSGQQTVSVIAEHIGSSPETVRSKLATMENRGRVIRLTESAGGKRKETQWGLVDTNRVG